MATGHLLQMKTLIASFVLVFGALDVGRSTELPKGYVLAEDSISPDGRYGVSVPLTQAIIDDIVKDPVNNLVEVSSGKTIARMVGNPGFTKQNHGGIMPSIWSPDSSLLLWHVDGKWFPDALTLIEARRWKGRMAESISSPNHKEPSSPARKKPKPELYARAKKGERGSGSALSEGFSVDVVAVEPVALPMKVLVDLHLQSQAGLLN